jgi:hypothetical protein
LICSLPAASASASCTAAHELVHHFLTVGEIHRHPDWVNEGIPEFFEKFMGYIAGDGQLHISFWYFSNWRFPAAKAKIGEYTLPKLFQQFEPSLAGSFILFLHRQGCLRKFVHELQAGGKDAKPEEILAAVYGQPLGVIEREWKAWVAGQAIDADVNLVPLAFVKTEPEWQAWLRENKDRLVWDEKLARYRGVGK